MNNIEIIGITTVGTYPSWVEYTIASMYNNVDKIIVVNSGYDTSNPKSGATHKLKREHEQLQKIDINKKITEYTPSEEDIMDIFETTCKDGKDEVGRSTNMTLSTQIAYNLPNPKNKERWILKADSDQIFYKFNREDLENLIEILPSKTGFRFAQYADYFHDFKHIGFLPDEFTNDGSLFYKSLYNQGYCGQGSPGYIKVDQHPIYSLKTSHMRRICPSDVEPYEYHFKRLWYHTYAPNSINEHDYNRKTGKKLTNEQVKEIAHKETISILRNKGRKISELPYDYRTPYEPPLVCQLSPIEYIKKGY